MKKRKGETIWIMIRNVISCLFGRHNMGYYCLEFGLECRCGYRHLDHHLKCEYCGGSGKIPVMEQVYAGEPHYADIGAEKDCICVIEE